jgi:LPXTG-motif cell wall-anchored protein
MRTLKHGFWGFSVLALILVFAPMAKDSVMDQKVIGTFNAPVMIPGQTLSAGTYVFKVLDVPGSRDVVQVFTADESRVLATAFTVPRYRENPGDKQIFQFEERGPGSPQAIKSWFYPGFRYGHEFVYPKTTAVETVSSVVNNPAESVPAFTSSTEEPAATTPEEPTAEEPTPAVAENTPIAEQSQTPQSSSAPAQQELPKTASSIPLIALVGILLLGAAGVLRAFGALQS